MKTHLVFGSLTVLMLVIIIGARRQEAFTFARVVTMAETMAKEGYLSTTAVLPKSLRSLDYDQYRDIRWRDERTLWRRQGLPFQVKFFHPGYLYDRPVEIFEVDGGVAEPLRYSPAFFDFGRNQGLAEFPDSMGYAGFRVYHPINKPDVLDEILVFLGASYFRALPRDLHWGASARGLAIDAAVDKRKEEFPAFTKFWLKKPDPYAKQFTVYALLEGRSVTGAYEFVTEPGAETRIHVKAVLFFRKPAEHAGYAPLTSMYWFGENTSNTFGGFRPEVHDSDGLQIQRGNGEWVWRPLSWSRQIQINVFADDHPKGFGLLQRDRDFNHYQDLEALYHKRPSVWVQPLWGFDKGAVRLVQLPTKDEFQDNVVAMWTPAEPPRPLQPVQIEYVLRWFGDASDVPPVGRCVSTRVDYQDAPYFRHFFLDFAGGGLKAGTPPAADIRSMTDGVISEIRVEWNDFNASWRVSFVVSTAENHKPVEVACRLSAEGKPLTETWTYTWTP